LRQWTQSLSFQRLPYEIIGQARHRPFCAGPREIEAQLGNEGPYAQLSSDSAGIAKAMLVLIAHGKSGTGIDKPELLVGALRRPDGSHCA
jgi:hypothetical protein